MPESDMGQMGTLHPNAAPDSEVCHGRPSADPKRRTKRLRVRLSASVRHEFEAIVEVPVVASRFDQLRVALALQESIGAERYVTDAQSWAEHEPEVELVAEGPSEFFATTSDGEHWTLDPVATRQLG